MRHSGHATGAPACGVGSRETRFVERGCAAEMFRASSGQKGAFSPISRTFPRGVFFLDFCTDRGSLSDELARELRGKFHERETKSSLQA